MALLKPRVIAINGPQEGHVYPLPEGRFSVGRHVENDLTLSSLEVSRRHCEITCAGQGQFVLRDLGSRHGVLVNGRPVREWALSHSDLVTVGRSVLLFLLDDDVEEPAYLPVNEGPVLADSTVIKKPSELFYLDVARVETQLPSDDAIARDLHALLEAGRRLQGPLDLEGVGRRVLDAVRALVPSERRMVLVREAGSDRLETLAWQSDWGGEFQAGRSVLKQMMDEAVGVWFGGVRVPEGGDSIIGIGSVLCAPFLHAGEVCGAVYVDSRGPSAFQERHLELVGAIAGFASATLQNALHVRRLEDENARLQEVQLSHDIVGESAPIRRLLDLVSRVSRVETTVLIRGESGTGKELAAQAIHRSSARSRGPFVAINCATLSENLLESELFGHERGAFTGAVQRQTGKLEAARGGTLFLDEVGELPPSIQAKLLRVLQEREFCRVGSTQAVRADVRLVAATNRDLEAAIRAGEFREDLYYRLKVITLETPALRHRRDDIPLLAHHFLAMFSRRLSRLEVRLSDAARRCLMTYSWPGNVRELGNVIERALVLGDGDVIQPEDLPEELLDGAAEPAGGFQEAVTETKKKLILRAWRDGGRDYKATAQILGVHVNSLHRMISRLGIKDQLDLDI